MEAVRSFFVGQTSVAAHASVFSFGGCIAHRNINSNLWFSCKEKLAEGKPRIFAGTIFASVLVSEKYLRKHIPFPAIYPQTQFTFRQRQYL